MKKRRSESSDADNSGEPQNQIRRKLLILAFLILLLLPMFLTNLSKVLKQAGVENLDWPSDHTFTAHHALLLCQHWTLFSTISPFNYTTHVAVQLKDGTNRVLFDRAASYQGDPWAVLFHSETKTQNNLYGNPKALRQFAEFVIRQKRIDPDDVTETKIFIFYRNLLSRDEARRTGFVYGPEYIAELQKF